jgi:hypothetical protein
MLTATHYRLTRRPVLGLAESAGTAPEPVDIGRGLLIALAFPVILVLGIAFGRGKG